jgi:DNA-binding CsgD family transcriptional regulator
MQSSSRFNPCPVAPRLLSRRELQCLVWTARGKSSTDIGAILGLSPRTVDSYIEKACGKLGVRTRVEAVTVAIRRQLLDPGAPDGPG